MKRIIAIERARKASALESDFALLWRLADGPSDYQTEYRFHPERDWRFDVAFPDEKVAIELDGGTWGNGRHNRGRGYQGDCDKINAAVAMGWAVLRYTADDVRKRTTAMRDDVEAVLESRRKESRNDGQDTLPKIEAPDRG